MGSRINLCASVLVNAPWWGTATVHLQVNTVQLSVQVGVNGRGHDNMTLRSNVKTCSRFMLRATQIMALGSREKNNVNVTNMQNFNKFVSTQKYTVTNIRCQARDQQCSLTKMTSVMVHESIRTPQK